jgi:hypothetical protein
MLELILLLITLLFGFARGYLIRMALSARHRAALKRYLYR